MCDVRRNLEDFGDLDWGQKMQVTRIRKDIAAGRVDPASVSFACKFREGATQH